MASLRSLKCGFYRAAKAVGLFRVARRLTRDRLRILGYHGFELHDESRFRPRLFTDLETFRRRLDLLQREGYPVLSLDEAVERFEAGTLPPCAVVLTFDDGFHSIHRLAVPELKARGMPATIHLTTYYAEKENPVFRLAVQYIFWKTQAPEVDLGALGLPGGEKVRLDSAAARDQACWRVIGYGETELEEPQRVELARRLGAVLGVDYDELQRRRIVTLMTRDEVRAAAREGIDVQLHTHRHRFPNELEACRREVVENRRWVEEVTGRPANHLCYPSGEYHPRLFPVLRELGIKSGTTCETGLNEPGENVLRLSRFGDNSEVRHIEFEAELSGFAELVRGLLGPRPRSA